MTLTRLIADDGFSKPLDKSCHCVGILSLVHEPSDGALGQQFLGYLLDFFECSVAIVGSGRCDHGLVRVPGQPPTSIRLLGVSIYRGGGDVLFEPVQLRNKILDLLPDIFRMLGASASVARDSHSFHQYLVMVDERIHAA